MRGSSSQTRDQTHASCALADGFFTLDTREALSRFSKCEPMDSPACLGRESTQVLVSLCMETGLHVCIEVAMPLVKAGSVVSSSRVPLAFQE